MYKVLLQRSTGSKEHFKKILLIFFCSRIVLQKMYEVLLQRSIVAPSAQRPEDNLVTLLSALLSLTASHWSPVPGEGF